MSRYRHVVERDGVSYEVAYGYDRPLSEYFLQVFTLNGEDEDPYFSIGNYYTMTPHPDNLEKIEYSNSEIMELMIEWECPQKYIDAVGSDLPY